MTLAKICGLSTPETVAAALAGKAAYLGFMFFEKSPRNIAPDAAWRLAQSARGKARIVAVLVDPDDAQVDRVAQVIFLSLQMCHIKHNDTTFHILFLKVLGP